MGNSHCSEGRRQRPLSLAHNTSPAILANHGIGINDPRVQQLFTECAQNASPPPGVVATPVYSAPTGPYSPDFKVGGLTVGGVVAPDSAAYQAYTCRPSPDYPGFQWCGLHRQVKAVARSLNGKSSYIRRKVHWGDVASAVSAQVPVSAYSGPNRPLTIAGEQIGNAQEAQLRANHEMNLNVLDICGANITTPGWLMDDGSLWMYHLTAPVLLFLQC